MSIVIGKQKLAPAMTETKQQVILRLLDHILQPSVFEDVRSIANTWSLEQNQSHFPKPDVVKSFLEIYQAGMLPRGEVFVDSSTTHVHQAVKVFHLLYFAKDFDVFVNVACWLRERINPGLFVYALTAAVFHRVDCKDIVLPAPYEIYPYLFVNSDVIHKAFMMKMAKGDGEPAIMDYWGIKVDKNVCYIDSRKGLRYTLSLDDALSYFTEDIDLNTYMYYLHMSYPYWMDSDLYSVHKERRGETMLYTLQQLLARLRLERLSHGMPDIMPINWDETLKTGYWPKIRLHTGDEMPCRFNDTSIVHDYNLKIKETLEDFEKLVRLAILKGKVEKRDGTVLPLKKPEDIEVLGRLQMGGLPTLHDEPTVAHPTNLMRKMLTYATYNNDKYTYVPTASDMYATFLRDPAVWRVLKRITETSQLFKRQLPTYTRLEFDFPGVKIEDISTTELVTFLDSYDMDITNALYLSESEVHKKRSDMLFVARQRRMNNQPFKVTVDVTSGKSVDAVVRVFLGPKYDNLGRLTDVNDKRLDMVEMDSFLYKLKAGKNSIVRNSTEMQGVIEDRPFTRRMWDQLVRMDDDERDYDLDKDWWYRTRVGFPHRLLLPLGRRGGLELQLFVVVSPVRTGYTLPSMDMSVTQERHSARWSTGVDTMPLGFPFDRVIDTTQFFTGNMMFADVMVYRKEEAPAQEDFSNAATRRDDLSVLDNDLL